MKNKPIPSLVLLHSIFSIVEGFETRYKLSELDLLAMTMEVLS